MLSARYSLQILMKLEISPQILKKYRNIKFYENSFSGRRVVPCGWTEEQTERQIGSHDEVNSHFSQFCTSAYNFHPLPAGINFATFHVGEVL